MTLNHII